MCGRATLVTEVEEIARVFSVPPIALGPARFNVAPGQPVLILRAAPHAGTRELAVARWGLAPVATAGTTASSARRPHVMARAETVERMPAFRDAFRTGRCLFIADGFFEWKAASSPAEPQRRPHYVRRADGLPFAIAAISGPAPTEDTCAVITTASPAHLRDLHDRVPLVLDAEAQASWLESAAAAHGVVTQAARLTARAMGGFVVTPVSPWVNDVRHDDPRCIEPAAELSTEPTGQIALRFD